MSMGKGTIDGNVAESRRVLAFHLLLCVLRFEEDRHSIGKIHLHNDTNYAII